MTKPAYVSAAAKKLIATSRHGISREKLQAQMNWSPITTRNQLSRLKDVLVIITLKNGEKRYQLRKA